MAKPVYALVGNDSFLQLEKLAEIRAGFGNDVQIAEFDGDDAQLAEVLDELRSFAMFGGSKLVIMRNADDFISRFREQLEEYLNKPSNSGTLVMRVQSLPKTQRIYKQIAKVGSVEVCDPPPRLQPWITERGKKVHKLTIDAMAANMLADLIGADLGRIDNELAKLALQVGSGKVTQEAILGSVSFQREQEIKDMTIELATGRPADALRRWRYLVHLDSSAEFRAVTWLTMWLEDVGVVLGNGDVGKMSWKYRERFNDFLRMARGLGKDRHRRAVDHLAELDKRSKSGLGDAVVNVEQFILSFA